MARLLLVLALIFGSGALADEPPQAWLWAWPDTDFSKSTVEFSAIRSGGPGKDGIPAITDPEMIPVGAEIALAPREPVITVEIGGETPRAHPVRYLIWHEIANDVVGDTPIAVTYCPLCNSAVTFDRRVEGAKGERVLEFGVSGLLRHSDMVMYDRQTESWWQQFVGEAIVGEMTGARLQRIPSWMESWADFSARNPDGLVMAEPTSHRRAYGRIPYRGYDTSERPFLYNGDPPPHGVHPLARVVVVGGSAWPLIRLSTAGEIVEGEVRLTWGGDQASAMDVRDIPEGRNVGNVRVYDAQTGAPLPHDVAFAFAFHAFYPDGVWMVD